MPEKRRLSGLAQALLAFAVLYGAVTLLPAAVYGAIGAKQGETPQESRASSVPGFLEEYSVAGPSSALQKDGGTFALYDQSSEKSFTLTAKELLPGALACEMDLAAPEEALKAQTVACYTLFCRKRAAGEVIVCDTENWQTWVPEETMEERWGEDFAANLKILQRVTESVAGQLLTFDGEPILAAYFAISSGATEAAANVWECDMPYLRAVASPGDRLADGYLSTVSFTEEEFIKAACARFHDSDLDFSGEPETWLSDLEYTPSGYVKTGALGGVNQRGADLRSAFSLRSACFTVEHVEKGFIFTMRGWGHGVGLSQAGAAAMAKQGETYQTILSTYYPGTVLTFPE